MTFVSAFDMVVALILQLIVVHFCILQWQGAVSLSLSAWHDMHDLETFWTEEGRKKRRKAHCSPAHGRVLGQGIMTSLLSMCPASLSVAVIWLPHIPHHNLPPTLVPCLPT